MAQTITTAGDATTGLIQAAGDDGTYVIKTGAAGTKVNAVSYAADGTPTQPKGTTVGSAPMAVPTGSAPMFACRAWVNFDGTGTPAIRGSGNVSSITKNGTGDYTVNFTVALPDANYGYTTCAGQASASSYWGLGPYGAAPAAGAFRLNTGTSSANYDLPHISCAFFR